MSETVFLPDACGIAFKEWSGVCAALAEGRQSVILRKGGIAEANGRFIPEHGVFWLYPTHLHERQQGLRIEPPEPVRPATHVDISALAVIAEVLFIDRRDALEAMADMHVWTRETVQRRFEYRTPGLWVFAVRVYCRATPLRIEATPAHAGCKSWVPLEVPPQTSGLSPSLSDAEFACRMDQLRAAVSFAREPSRERFAQ